MPFFLSIFFRREAGKIITCFSLRNSGSAVRFNQFFLTKFMDNSTDCSLRHFCVWGYSFYRRTTFTILVDSVRKISIDYESSLRIFIRILYYAFIPLFYIFLHILKDFLFSFQLCAAFWDILLLFSVGDGLSICGGYFASIAAISNYRSCERRSFFKE